MLLLGRKGQKGQGHSNVNTEPSTLGIQNFAKTMRTKPHDSSTMESDERWDDVSDEDLLMVDLAALGGSGTLRINYDCGVCLIHWAINQVNTV